MTLFSRHYLAAALAFGAVSLVGSPALAQTATLSLNVTVQNACTISGGTIDFGTYTIGQAEDKDATGIISFENCSGSQVTASLDGGTSGNAGARHMSNGVDTLGYQLYTDVGRVNPWFDYNTGISGIGLNELTVYGRIPAGQTVTDTSGTYEDTLMITMIFLD